MSLVAWYPLNGNTNDYSGNGYHLTGTPTYTSNGKIGQAVDINRNWGSSTGFTDSICAGDFSVAFWIKIPYSATYTVSQPIGTNTSRSMNLFVYPSLYDFHGSQTGGWVDYGFFTTDTWIHVTVVFNKKNGIAYRYKNGTLFASSASTTNSVGNTFQIGNPTYYSSDVELNDIRFYDHALSEKEIKEITKAKILHYTFDDFQEPTNNLYVCPKSNSEFNVIGNGIFTVESYSINEVIYKYDYTQNLIWTYHGMSFPVTSGVKYTYSCDVYISANSNATGNIWVFNIEGNLPASAYYNANNKGTWQTLTGTVTASGTGNATFFLYPSTSTIFATTGYVLYRNPRVEQKTYSTPFINGSRSGIVNDQSGFRNNATLTESTTPQWVNDSKIGSGAYKFYNNYITNSIYTPEHSTINLWYKYTDISSPQSPFTINSTAFEISVGSGQLWVGYVIDGVRRAAFAGPSTLFDGNWHMLSSTFDGINIKAYLDGLILETWNYPGGLTRGSLTYYIGSMGGSYYVHGYLDDVRMYATALSDADVLELYQTRASLDNIGNLFTTEIIQDLSSYSSEYKANNLVINGSAQLGNKTNFSGFNDYINTDGYDDLNCFKSINLYSTTLSDNLIKINKNDTYYLSGYFKSVGSAGLSPLYFGGYCIDKNGNFIEHHMVNHYFSTRTTLAADLVNGATTVQLTSSANWIMDNPGSQQWNKLICFWHSGNEYPIYTYTRLSLDFISISGNTVTLLNPWSSGTIPAGTPVANSYHGGTFSYWAAGYYQVPTTWSRATATITGWGVNEEYKFRYGTEYIRIMFLTNYASGDYQTLIDKVEFFNLTSYQSLPINQGVKSNSILYSSKISELGITNGLIAYYPFDKDARDYSGNGRHGVINGNPVLASGIKNLAYNFNGTSDFISIDKSFPDPGIDNFTYSIWFYSPTLRSGEVFGKRATANIEMQISSNGAIYTYLSDTAGTTYSSTLYYSASTWYHYCITRSGTQVIIYLNGQNQANITLPANFNISPSTSNLEIARDPGNSGEYFHGNVDEFRVYNRSLSQEEISILYETTAPSTAAMKITKDTVYVKNEIKEVY